MIKKAPIKNGQVKVGDWIQCISKSGKIVLGEVKMINPLGDSLGKFGLEIGDSIHTDIGVFYPESIIEIRR